MPIKQFPVFPFHPAPGNHHGTLFLKKPPLYSLLKKSTTLLSSTLAPLDTYYIVSGIS